MQLERTAQWKEECKLVEAILGRAPEIDKSLAVPRSEFELRQRKVAQALAEHGLDIGVVYSNEHYNGDVPYLGGNTNISIEPVAGVMGKNGFHLLAGLEGAYIAEQLSPRSGAKVHKLEMLKLADEDYPISAERLEDVLEEACGYRPRNIGLLTPKAVVPASIVDALRDYVGSSGELVDAQELYHRIKYEKSDTEMALIKQASQIADVAVRAMLAVLKPGMLETQVAAWGYLVAKELGAEEMGFDIMVTANEANRTLVGKALNRPIREGDFVHVGIAPKRDGLNACERVSVIAVPDPSYVPNDAKYWFDLVEEAYQVGFEAYCKVAREGLPARLQEQALQDFFASKSAEVSTRIGRPVDLVRQKPYTGTHNAGYTECQEFFGAITLGSEEVLGRQIVTMLDVAVRGVGQSWDDIVIPGLDYVVVERTLGKRDGNVETLTKLPLNVQHLVGRIE